MLEKVQDLGLTLGPSLFLGLGLGLNLFLGIKVGLHLKLGLNLRLSLGLVFGLLIGLTKDEDAKFSQKPEKNAKEKTKGNNYK